MRFVEFEVVEIFEEVRVSAFEGFENGHHVFVGVEGVLFEVDVEGGKRTQGSALLQSRPCFALLCF